MTTPDWLTQRGGALKIGSDGKTWFVLFGQQPIYSLASVPIAGKHGCVIRQTNSGKRIDCSAAVPSADEALQAGLRDLRHSLGWG